MNITDFKNKKILITGFTGLIGTALVNFFKETKIDGLALILASRSEQDATNLPNFTIIKNEEISNIESLDYIFHLASPTHSEDLFYKPVETILNSIDLARSVLDLSVKTKAKIIYMSSVEVYGYKNSDKKIEEKELGYIDLKNARSSYPEMKRIIELLIHCYYTEHKINYNIIRLAQCFGKGVSSEDNRIFAFIAKSILKDKDIELNSSGETIKDYISTDDAITAMLSIALNGKPSETYNLTNENNVASINDLCLICNDVCKTNFNKHNVKVIHNLDTITTKKYPREQIIKMSSEKLFKDTGFKAKKTIYSMFYEMIHDWKI